MAKDDAGDQIWLEACAPDASHWCPLLLHPTQPPDLEPLNLGHQGFLLPVKDTVPTCVYALKRADQAHGFPPCLPRGHFTFMALGLRVCSSQSPGNTLPSFLSQSGSQSLLPLGNHRVLLLSFRPQWTSSGQTLRPPGFLIVLAEPTLTLQSEFHKYWIILWFIIKRSIQPELVFSQIILVHWLFFKY